VLDSRIGVDGSITDIRVVRSAHEELTRAARDAASQWRFEPTRLWGTPVEAHMIMTFNFERQSR
jgi:TonB family protein